MENQLVINVINISTDQVCRTTNPHITAKDIQRSREERLISVCKQSKQQGFAFRVWEGIIDERGGCFGINLAFKKIIRWAKAEDLPMVCIAEDDILFSAPGAWDYYLEQMPEEFDIYSGGVYSGQVQDGRILNGYSGNTLLTIKKSFYNFILSLPDTDHLDRLLGRYAFEKDYRIVEPYVCFQMQGYSENLRRPTSHGAYLESMKESKRLFGV